MKVIGIGLNKTGTSTLGFCMRYWKFKHISYNKKAFELWRQGNYDALFKWIDRYDSFEDWPWPLFYQQIDQEYPDAKFVLTRRKNPEVWFSSLLKHANRIGPTAYRKSIYGHSMPHNHKEDHIRIYENHLQTVREYFKDRPDDLLEVCWAEGDDWDKLADFLGLEKPNEPFPHVNKKPKRLGKVKRFIRKSARNYLKI